MSEYTSPVVDLGDVDALEENEAWWVAPLAVAAWFGGAWAWCKAMCGWNNVRSCSTSWLRVTAVCR